MTVPEGLDVRGVLFDQLVERKKGSFRTVLVDRLLDQIAADDIRQISLRQEQVHRLVVVLGVLPGGRVLQMDIGQLARFFLDWIDLARVPPDPIALGPRPVQVDRQFERLIDDLHLLLSEDGSRQGRRTEYRQCQC